MRDDFRAVLKRSPVRARDEDARLAALLESRGFRLDDKRLKAAWAPWLIDPNTVRELTRSVRAISHLLEQVVELALNSVTFMEQIGISPNIEELVLNDAPGRLAIEFARYDFLPAPGGPRFLEFNVDSPAGAAFSSVLDNEFQQTESAREAGLHTLFPSAPTVDLYCDALLAAYAEHARATVEKPNVAIVDFAGVSTAPEQEMVAQCLRRRGYVADLVDPREFEFRKEDRGLYHNGTRYHLVCRRALVPELARRRVLVAQLIHAFRHGDVVVVNPVRSRIASNKGVLEILTSGAFDRFFTPAENQLKARLLPWTRKLVARRTDYLGRDVDLLEFVAANPEKLVLKPGGAYGGESVVLGPFVTRQQWQAALDETIRQQGVVQEYVPVARQSVPVLEGASYAEQEKYMILGAFAVRGEYAGCIGRVSDDPVVNVRRGGGVLPVLELGGRSKTGPIEAARPRRRRTTGQNR
ncbi:MAG: glutathionylspermidine synthase family protein [Planctomycetes bacterium]|jgi:glutathionylspermidine synthase|nr:glutathionylspermidine synthase family protein [Planctomycetota bacterium]